MAKPIPVRGSPFLHSRLIVPAPLRGILGRSEFRAALRGPTEAAREAEHLANLADWKGQIAAARARLTGDLQHLTDRHISALCGFWYGERLASVEATGPIDPAQWELEAEGLIDQFDRDEEDPHWWSFTPSKRDLAEAERFLTEQGVAAAPASVARFSERLHLTKIDAARTLIRRGRGDFGPDRVAERFAKELPTKALPAPEEPPAASGATFGDLVRGWARDAGYDPDAKPIPAPFYGKNRTAIRLAAFVGHDDAARLTKADVSRWKQDMQARGKSPKTVRNDISELSGAFAWGVRHGLLTANVFEGMLPPKKTAEAKAKKVRTYTDAEVGMLLGAARRETGALRWLVWCLALTGARLGEVVQSVKEDIVTAEGVDCLRIHDEDDHTRQRGEAKRSVKNAGSNRLVPIHPALQAEGFLDYVASLPAHSPLFPSIAPDSLFGTRAAIAQKIVSRWVRGLGISDASISPAHSFRHWLITAARRGRVHRELRDAITGHSLKLNEADDYGISPREMPTLLLEAIAKVAVPPIESLPE